MLAAQCIVPLIENRNRLALRHTGLWLPFIQLIDRNVKGCPATMRVKLKLSRKIWSQKQSCWTQKRDKSLLMFDHIGSRCTVYSVLGSALHSDLCSMVCCMNPLIAAHLFPIPSLACDEMLRDFPSLFEVFDCIIWDMFLLNLSLSILIKVSFFFIAPGLLFKLLCLILASPITVSPFWSSDRLGKACARDSRVVTSFFDGRLRFLEEGFDFSIRETKAARLIVRLSFFVVLNTLLDSRRASTEGPLLLPVGPERIEERWPGVGA